MGEGADPIGIADTLVRAEVAPEAHQVVLHHAREGFAAPEGRVV